MVSHIRPVVVMIALFTLLTGIVFPVGFVELGQLAFPSQANGSMIVRNGQAVGSRLLGQDFTSDKYLHGRPSALMGADPKDSSKQVSTPYDASESGASNLSPTSKTLVDRVTADVARTGAKNVPADMVTTSASGLDPDVSPEDAALQVSRVAKARGMSPDAVQAIVAAHTQGPELGFIGATRVNVLETNLALDEASGERATTIGAR